MKLCNWLLVDVDIKRIDANSLAIPGEATAKKSSLEATFSIQLLVLANSLVQLCDRLHSHKNETEVWSSLRSQPIES